MLSSRHQIVSTRKRYPCSIANMPFISGGDRNYMCTGYGWKITSHRLRCMAAWNVPSVKATPFIPKVTIMCTSQYSFFSCSTWSML